MNTPAPRAPRPMFGFLAAGETRTRKFPVLPNGVMPILQNFPGGTVGMVSMGKDHITVENTGNKGSPFSVLFVNQLQLKKLSTVKQVFDVIAEHRRNKS